MLGLIIGTACLFALAHVLRRERWHAHAFAARHGWHPFHAHAGGCGHHGYGPHHACGQHRRDDRADDRDEARRGFERRDLYPLLRRLDLSPAQEKVVFAAADELHEKAAALRDAWVAGRRDVAATIAAPALSPEQATLLVGKFDPPLDALRDAIAAGLGKVHEVLDDRQRRLLGEMIELAGPGAFRL